jgi:hypothetical protein
VRALRRNGTSGRAGPKRVLHWSKDLAHGGKNLALVSGTLFFFLLISAIAQIELPSVIVVGHPAEISPDLAAQQSLFSRYAGAATIVEPGDFGLSRGSYLSDYIRFVPGVLITAAQGSEDTQISIRGSGNLENDTIAGIELVVDGIVKSRDRNAILSLLIKYDSAAESGDNESANDRGENSSLRFNS